MPLVPNQVNVYVGGKLLYSEISEASKRGDIRIHANASGRKW